MTTERWRRIVRFIPLALVLAAAAAVLASGVWRRVSLEALQHQQAHLTAFVAAHPWQAVLVYLAVYTVVVGLSLPLALVMTLSAGFLFGPWEGGLWAAVGATMGSTLFFVVCRTAFGDMLRRKAGPRLQKMQDGIRADAFHYLLTIRLIPAFPLWLVNLAAGLVEMRLRIFLPASFLGMVPSSLVYASIGSGLGKVFASGEKLDAGLLIQPHVILPLVGLALLAGASVAWRRFRPRGDC